MGDSVTVNPSEFTAEQKEYLQGFFTSVAQRGFNPFAGHTSNGLITADAASCLPNLAAVEAEPCWFGTPVSDLAREERWKYEQDPFAIWDKVLEYSNRNQPPSDDDRFRLKYLGLFHVAPAQDSFMLRLRVPGGILYAHQLRGLAQLTESYGSGRVDLTTRSNLQIREFKPRDIVRVLNRVQTLGLTSHGSGADNIRNVTASPLTGLDPHELIDVAPLAEAMQSYITNTPEMYDLPRKFNIAFDNGGSISTLADTNDIGFMAVRVVEGRSVPAGVYFRVMLCGITGHRQFATDCGLLLRPEETVAVAAAMVRVFVRHGDRTDRKKARLKYLVDQWGVDRFIEETESNLAFPLIRVEASECEPRHTIHRTAHLGIHTQSQSGLHYMGVCVPVGHLPATQVRSLADIAERFGTGELRLTVWQNVIIPNITAGQLDAARQALVDTGLSYEATTVLSGTVACTGNQGCRFAAADTKSHAVLLARHLDERFPMLDQPVNLHVTGCSHSCAQHYIGDIGLMGIKVSGEEGYQVIIGGGADGDQGIGRELISSIRFTDLKPKLDNLFSQYVLHRTSNETFLQFTRRYDITTLQSFCNREIA
ncbi:MAG: NirA family protein [Acidobacteria bacterium]|nr:NirA family protein [Acidobacteriota bacterium]